MLQVRVVGVPDRLAEMLPVRDLAVLVPLAELVQKLLDGHHKRTVKRADVAFGVVVDGETADGQGPEPDRALGRFLHPHQARAEHRPVLVPLGKFLVQVSPVEHRRHALADVVEPVLDVLLLHDAFVGHRQREPLARRRRHPREHPGPQHVLAQTAGVVDDPVVPAPALVHVRFEEPGGPGAVELRQLPPRLDECGHVEP